MRTTLSLDDDVIDKARKAAEKSGRPFREVINEALRAGLRSLATVPDAKPYTTKPRKMGLKPGRNLDNIQDLLAQIEGEEFR
jgi:Bacterial antitoxin of type II TA system, VapB